MIAKHKIYYKDGSYKTNVRIVEAYRPGGGKTPRQRQIKNLGYAEDHEDQAAFWAMVEAEEQAFKQSKEAIHVDLAVKLSLQDTRQLSIGHKYVESVYKFLELDKFFKGLQQNKEYDLEAIFRYFVVQRVLHPDSIRAGYQMIGSRYGDSYDFRYLHIMKALDVIEQHMEELQDHMNSVIERKIGRKNEYFYYDTTNFYLEKDMAVEGTLGQKGVSKEHRTNPIVQYGMFMDSNRLPVRMMVFPGNTSDSLTYLPMIKQLKSQYGYDRIISVADKGMNSTDNVSYIHYNGDGYVFSQILKGQKGKRYHEKMFEEDAFTWNADRTYKYRLFDEDFTYRIKDADGTVREETQKRKVLIYWKKSIADREAHKRELKLRKAEKYATNNAYSLKHDATDYVLEQYVDSHTGAVADKVVKSVDLESAANDARFDGFFCIVTSEPGYDAKKIHEVYSQLSYIENSFRICKTDLNARPMFVRTDVHIKAHLAICFTSLLIMRLIQFGLGDNAISPERIQRALAAFQCEKVANGIYHLSLHVSNFSYGTKTDECGEEYISTQLVDRSETLSDLVTIQRLFGEPFTQVNVRQEALNKYLGKIRFATTLR